ncbi:MAG: hypothetical protein RJA81_2462, partial [Planctomycetota bacterium]
PVDAMGTPAWNEDLLDYLAGYFLEQGHDLKKLMSHIATSRAYQSVCSPHSENVSVEEYVFLGPELKRLTAEQFMDALWTITSTGPEKPVAPVTAATIPEDSITLGPKIRASLMTSDALQRSLGRPNREQVVTQRGEVLTTLQALDLSNGPQVTEMLAAGAARILESQKKPDGIIDLLFQKSLSRLPKSNERETARTILTENPTAETVADLLWVLAMLPEFELVR